MTPTTASPPTIPTAMPTLAPVERPPLPEPGDPRLLGLVAPDDFVAFDVVVVGTEETDFKVVFG